MDIVKVKYTGQRSEGESAGKLTHYLTYRRELVKGEDGKTRYRTVEATRGDADAFRAAARQRKQDGRRAQYVHIVVSPENSNDLEDGDLLALAEPWIRDHNGATLEHYATVHRDGNRPHLHIAVARDKFIKQDMEAKKEQTRELIHEREQVRALDADLDLELSEDLEQLREEELSRKLEEQRQHQEQTHGLERGT